MALTAEHAWLEAPRSASTQVADSWLSAEAGRIGAEVRPGGGLLESMSVLDGPHVDTRRLDPQVADFYQNTSVWRMEVWSQWEFPFQPAGALIEALFGRRVRQLAIPTRPLDVAHGMDSEVRRFVVGDRQVGAAWLRRLRSTGAFVYSGHYRTARIPGSAGPVVHVSFPLPAGNVQVFLEPSVGPDGALRLSSPGRRFGGAGAYVVVDERGTHAALVPLRETFRVYTDADGVLRTDHELRLWRWRVLRLHYRLERTGSAGSA